MSAQQNRTSPKLEVDFLKLLGIIPPTVLNAKLKSPTGGGALTVNKAVSLPNTNLLANVFVEQNTKGKPILCVSSLYSLDELVSVQNPQDMRGEEETGGAPKKVTKKPAVKKPTTTKTKNNEKQAEASSVNVKAPKKKSAVKKTNNKADDIYQTSYESAEEYGGADNVTEVDLSQLCIGAKKKPSKAKGKK